MKARRNVANAKANEWADSPASLGPDEALEANDLYDGDYEYDDDDDKKSSSITVNSNGSKRALTYVLVVLCCCFTFAYFFERDHRFRAINEYNSKIQAISTYLTRRKGEKKANHVILPSTDCPECPDCPGVPMTIEPEGKEKAPENSVDKTVFETVTWSWKTKTEALIRGVQKMSKEMVSNRHPDNYC